MQKTLESLDKSKFHPLDIKQISQINGGEPTDGGKRLGNNKREYDANGKLIREITEYVTFKSDDFTNGVYCEYDVVHQYNIQEYC